MPLGRKGIFGTRALVLIVAIVAVVMIVGSNAPPSATGLQVGDTCGSVDIFDSIESKEFKTTCEDPDLADGSVEYNRLCDKAEQDWVMRAKADCRANGASCHLQREPERFERMHDCKFIGTSDNLRAVLFCIVSAEGECYDIDACIEDCRGPYIRCLNDCGNAPGPEGAACVAACRATFNECQAACAPPDP